MVKKINSEAGFSVIAAILAAVIVAIAAYFISSSILDFQKIGIRISDSSSCQQVLSSVNEGLRKDLGSLRILSYGPTLANSIDFPQGVVMTPDGYDKFAASGSISYISFTGSQNFATLPTNSSSTVLPQNVLSRNFLNIENSINRMLVFAAHNDVCCSSLDCFGDLLTASRQPTDMSLPPNSNIKVQIALDVFDINGVSLCGSNRRLGFTTRMNPKTLSIKYRLRTTLKEGGLDEKQCELSNSLNFTQDAVGPYALIQIDSTPLCVGGGPLIPTLTSNDTVNISLRTLGAVNSAAVPDDCYLNCIANTRVRACATRGNLGAYTSIGHVSCVENCRPIDPGSFYLCRIGERDWFFDNPNHWEPCHMTRVYACDGTSMGQVSIQHTDLQGASGTTTAELTLSNFTKNGDVFVDVRAVDTLGNVGPSYCAASGSCNEVSDQAHMEIRIPALNAATPSCSAPTCVWQANPFPGCPQTPCNSDITINRSVTCSCGPGNCAGTPPASSRVCNTPCSSQCQWMSPQVLCLTANGQSLPPCGSQGVHWRMYSCRCENPEASGNWEQTFNSSLCPADPNRPAENLGTPCMYNCPQTCLPPRYRSPQGHCCSPGTYNIGDPCYIPPAPNCQWQLGPWVCNGTIETRSVTCSCSISQGQCQQPQPSAEGSACGVTPTCAWDIGAWGACTAGQQTRTVVCRDSNGVNCSLCTQPPPVNTQTCGATCNWQMGEWGVCQPDATQTRTVSCSCTPEQGACSLPAPESTRTCTPPPPPPQPCDWRIVPGACQDDDSTCPNPIQNLGQGNCLDEPPKIIKTRTDTYACRDVSTNASCSTCTNPRPANVVTECGISQLWCPGYANQVGSCGHGYCCRPGYTTCQTGGCRSNSGGACSQCEPGGSACTTCSSYGSTCGPAIAGAACRCGTAPNFTYYDTCPSM